MVPLTIVVTSYGGDVQQAHGQHKQPSPSHVSFHYSQSSELSYAET